MKQKLYILLLLLSTIVVIFSVYWIFSIHFHNWKYELTSLGKLVLYWKPDLLLIIAFIFIKICLDKMDYFNRF